MSQGDPKSPAAVGPSAERAAGKSGSTHRPPVTAAPPSPLSAPLVFALARGPSRRPCGPESARVTRIPALTQRLTDVALVQAAGGKADSSVVTNGPVNVALLLGGLGS